MKKGLLYLEYGIIVLYAVFLGHLVYDYFLAGMFSALNINWTLTQLFIELLKAGLMIGAIELFRRFWCYYHKI